MSRFLYTDDELRKLTARELCILGMVHPAVYGGLPDGPAYETAERNGWIRMIPYQMDRLMTEARVGTTTVKAWVGNALKLTGGGVNPLACRMWIAEHPEA